MFRKSLFYLKILNSKITIFMIGYAMSLRISLNNQNKNRDLKRKKIDKTV